MGAIELIFLTVFVIFGVIGVIRGYGRELGVTMMLFIVLFVLGIHRRALQVQFTRLLTIFTGPSEATQTTARALIYCAISS